MDKWYCRTVLFARDVEESVNHYVEKLGFRENWKFLDEDDVKLVSQVSRDGLEIILNRNEEKAGKGRVFMSLSVEQVGRLRKEIKEKPIDAADSWWGMPVIEILDPDGNQLYFSYDDDS